MANEENLIPNSERTPSERRENAKKAGQASGEARRKKKLLKECMSELLDLPVTDKRNRKELEAMGIDAKELDNRFLLTAALFKKAIAGDVSAYKEIRDLLGEHSSDDLGRIDEIIGGIDDTAAE